ncbi:MFS general substrate transporter [Nemania sp. FL0031]|nr:MFS general substrate transporter [Nemania sp. FL0031]
MLGDNLQPAALIQVFEAVICDEHYKAHPVPVTAISNTTFPLSDALPPNRCEAQPIQKELALLRGFQQFVPVFAALLCTIPYGLLAERIGRRRVLILSGAGIFASFSWVIAVCYFRFVPIRWVLLSGIFLFIGGGDAVTSSVIHAIVTDATSRAERAQIFLYLHAADVVSGFFGPAISGALMEKGYTWTILILADVTLFSGAFILTQFIPETLAMKSSNNTSPASECMNPHPITPSTGCSILSSFSKTVNDIRLEVYGLLSPLLDILKSNRQAILLLGIFAPQTAARELFTVIGPQYSKAKYSLSYARSNILLALFQGAQGLFVVFLLPLVTRTIADPRGWTPWSRDRRYTISSIAITAFGLLVIGFAPAVAVETIGLLLIALGSCTTGLLMSLLSGTVRLSQVSAVYSTALMLSVATRSVVGPVASALLANGLDLGRAWMGLPFAVMSILMVGVSLVSGFIRKEKGVIAD